MNEEIIENFKQFLESFLASNFNDIAITIMKHRAKQLLEEMPNN